MAFPFYCLSSVSPGMTTGNFIRANAHTVFQATPGSCREKPSTMERIEDPGVVSAGRDMDPGQTAPPHLPGCKSLHKTCITKEKLGYGEFCLNVLLVCI